MHELVVKDVPRVTFYNYLDAHIIVSSVKPKNSSACTVGIYPDI